MKQKTYHSVSELFSSDPKLQREIEEELSSRKLVRNLTACRVSLGISQVEMAKLMKTTQPKISRLENGRDSELTLGMLESYCQALNIEMSLLFSMRGMILADQIKYHALSIRESFLELSKLADKDEAIAKGVAELHVQAFLNLNSFLMETASKLQIPPDDGNPHIQFFLSLQDLNWDMEIPSEKTDPIPTSKRPNQRRAKKKLRADATEPKDKLSSVS